MAGTVLERANSAVRHMFHTMMIMPVSTKQPPNQRTTYRGLIVSKLAKNECTKEPSACTSRHVMPAIMPAAHMEMTYKKVPPRCNQKCHSMAFLECMFCPSTRGAMAYREPMVIMATQPKEPE